MKYTLVKVIPVLLALLMQAAFGFAAAAEGSETDPGPSLDAFIAEHESTMAGLAVSVFTADKTLYENYAGFADIENGLRVSEDTVFEWGSTTKLLVWVSVMQLWEKGLIDLSADVRTYLPDGFLTNLTYSTPVTMLDLMNHRAGFQELISDLMLSADEDTPSLGEALRLHEPKQVYEPDTVTAYSNWGAALAGYIVECVSGESFCDYVHAHIFSPLRMMHTALLPDLSDNEWVRAQRDLLQCYTTDAKLIPDCRYQIPMYPCGMCTGTLSDLMAFGQALLSENGPLFAESGTRSMLFSPSDYFVGTDLARNCHGFWVDHYGVPVIGHGGNTNGCSSYLMLDVENGLGYSVMTNQKYEEVFNSEMPALVFGQNESLLNRSLPKVIYRTSRTILTGPMKLYSASGYMSFSEDALAYYWVPNGEDATVVSWSTSEYFKLPVTTLILEWGLLLLLGAAALFSLIYLLFGLVGALCRRIRKIASKEDARRPLRYIAACLQLLLIGLIVFVVIQALRWAPSRSYRWCFAAAGLVMLLMAAAAVGLIIRRGARTKGARALNALSVLFLAGSVLNILYWQFFEFWAL